MNRGRRLRDRALAMIVLAMLLPSCASTSERTWAGEIGVCVQATGDVPGCEWLAGILIHRECRMETYQTFAAALTVGGVFQELYVDAVDRGDCADSHRSDLSGEDGG